MSNQILYRDRGVGGVYMEYDAIQKDNVFSIISDA